MTGYVAYNDTDIKAEKNIIKHSGKNVHNNSRSGSKKIFYKR